MSAISGESMGFLDDLRRMPLDIISKMEFHNRTVVISFSSGNNLKACCPDGNDQYETLKKEMKEKLPSEKFFDYDS